MSDNQTQQIQPAKEEENNVTDASSSSPDKHNNKEQESVSSESENKSPSNDATVPNQPTKTSFWTSNDNYLSYNLGFSVLVCLFAILFMPSSHLSFSSSSSIPANTIPINTNNNDATIQNVPPEMTQNISSNTQQEQQQDDDDDDDSDGIDQDGTLFKLIKTFVEAQVDDNIEPHVVASQVKDMLRGMVDQDQARVLVDTAIKSLEDRKVYADRHIRDFENVVSSDDCMTREFDYESPDYDPEEAANVFQKCKLLVIRNLFDKDYIRDVVKTMITQFVLGIQKGRTNVEGWATTGEAEYIAVRGPNRWEVLLTEEMIRETSDELLMNPAVMDVLQDPRVLGTEHLALHSPSVMFASSGATGQAWHEDDAYIFSGDSYPHTKVAGNDLPSYCVAVTIPLLDIRREHGPTEYCLGEAALSGLDIWNKDGKLSQEFVDNHVKDKSLLESGTNFHKFTELGFNTACHPDFWRSPTLNLGDAVFYDFQLKHRGGWNKSEDTRVVLFMTYSRYWYKDTVYRPQINPDLSPYEQYEDQLLRVTRFAAPNGGVKRCKKKECARERKIDLIDVGPLLLDDLEEEQEYDQHGEMIASEFMVSNYDITCSNKEEAPHLYLNKEKDLGELSAGNILKVQAKRGDVLSLVEESTSKSILEWDAHYKGQIVFTKDSLPQTL